MINNWNSLYEIEKSQKKYSYAQIELKGIQS